MVARQARFLLGQPALLRRMFLSSSQRSSSCRHATQGHRRSLSMQHRFRIVIEHLRRNLAWMLEYSNRATKRIRRTAMHCLAVSLQGAIFADASSRPLRSPQ
jgi:hypothetical protein